MGIVDASGFGGSYYKPNITAEMPSLPGAFCEAPPGVEGTIVGRSALRTDVQLRSFQIWRPWSHQLADDVGPEAREAWDYEKETPLSDVEPDMTQMATALLQKAHDLIHPPETGFDFGIWDQIAVAADCYLAEVGDLLRGAHAYNCRRRAARNPTTLTPAGLTHFRGLSIPGRMRFGELGKVWREPTGRQAPGKIATTTLLHGG